MAAYDVENFTRSDFIAALTLYVLKTIQIQMIENLLQYPEPVLIGLAWDTVPYLETLPIWKLIKGADHVG